MLNEDDRAGEALKALSAAEQAIPTGDPDARCAEAEIWDAIGLALMRLKELEGGAKAFQRAEFELGDRTYPRPDFDDVYNTTHMAVDHGDAALARRLVAVHHQLTLKSDLPHLDAWDDNLCAMVAETFGSPAEVPRCLRPLDSKLTDATFLAPRILPMRAIAAARLGDVRTARADLARIRALKASHTFQAAAFAREPEVVAELAAAEGRTGEALDRMRDYKRTHAWEETRQQTAGLHQLTAELQTELATARQSIKLQHTLLQAYYVVGLFAALLILGAAGGAGLAALGGPQTQGRPAGGRGGERRQERVSGQYEPRDPHAAERGRGRGRPSRRGRSAGARAADGGDHPRFRQDPRTAAVGRA
jgi:hypothetical protein